jgi:hypothetical protein
MLGGAHVSEEKTWGMGYDAIMDLTKAVNDLRSEMRSELGSLRTEMSELRSEMHVGLEHLGEQIGSLEGDMGYLKAKSFDTDKEIQWLRQRRV